MKPWLGWQRTLRRIGRDAIERLGIVGIAGVASLVVGIALGLSAPPLAQQALELSSSAERKRELLDQARAQLERQPPSVEQAAQLLGWFPTFERATTDLRTVFAAARNHHIELVKGEYALVATADASGLQRFEVVLPVKERYGAIKAFVAEVLREVPHASLAELRVERSAVNVEVLDARVRLTLFYRAA